MKFNSLKALGVLTAIASLASPALAQSPVATNSETEDITLSGTSLRTIENRTVDDDFDKFFLEDSSTAVVSESIGSDTNFNDPVGVNWDVTQAVEIEINEPLSPPTRPLVFQDDNERFTGIDRVEVLVELN